MSPDWIADVRAFHAAGGMALPTTPTIPDGARDIMRIDSLVNEEANEFGRALVNRDIENAAKEIVNVIYSAISSALELGLPVQALWDEIARSNATKVNGPGPIVRTALGKIAKGPNYVPPDVAGVLERADAQREAIAADLKMMGERAR